ncbi:unnamed protein product [Peronospora destructor]|uniref:Elicitin n=1 Tax=Peronospora destructor TaxID=86335 RepID=A0AAV0T053_9STRA|nr:unnamed protein product [Peronospora destructor]
MKFAVIVSAAALAAVTNADMCDVSTLQKLLILPNTKTCATKSGYMVTSLKTPTDNQREAMCFNPACQSILSQITTLAPTECTIGLFSLYADLINPVADHCNNGDSPAGSMATPIVTVESDNTASKSTTANVTGSKPASKTPTTSSDHVYTFTPTTTDDTTVEQTASSSGPLDDIRTKQTTTPPSKNLDDTSADTTSGATSVSMAALSAGVFVVAVATTIL